MSNHSDFSHLPPPSGQYPHAQQPPPGLGLLGTVGLIAVTVIVILGAGVGIGLFAFNPQTGETTPAAESTGTPEAQPSKQTPSPSEDFVNEDTEAAPPSSPEDTGECPDDVPDELVRGETQEYKVKLCLYEGAASADHVTYVGGNTEKGFTVLPADMYFDGMGNPYLEASKGGFRYVVDPRGLYVEGKDVIVDQDWSTGNMQELYDFATG